MDAEYYRKIVSGELRGPVPKILRFALHLPSYLYRLAVAARNRLFDLGILPTYKVGVPVISVGNVTVGGTGKTPFVELLCRRLLAAGRRPAIVSRGYGVHHGPNDEALVLAANLPQVPHVQEPDRVLAAYTAIDRYGCDTIVLDDGFQHRRLSRDLDIVLLDCTNPFGYGHVLPRGLLREPPRTLRRASAVVLTRADCVTEQKLQSIRSAVFTLAGDKPMLVATHRPTCLWQPSGETEPLECAANLYVVAFCGLGNPSAFWHTVSSLGCKLVATRAFPDHHNYTLSDVEELSSWVRTFDAELILTSQKDLVKLGISELGGRPLRAIKIRLHLIEGNDWLEQAIRSIAQPNPGPTKLAS